MTDIKAYRAAEPGACSSRLWDNEPIALHQKVRATREFGPFFKTLPNEVNDVE